MKRRQVMVWALLVLLITLIFNLSSPSAKFEETFFANASTAPQTQWSKVFGGAGNDGAYCVTQTSDGGYALAGFYNTWSNNHAFWFVKTDSSGTQQLSKTYGGVLGIDDAYGVIETSDGGYAITGFTNSSGAGNYDGWLVKLDSAANVEWNKTYGGATADDLYTVLQTGDGGYALAGYTTSFGAGAADSRLIKVDSSGNVMWNYTYGGTGVDDTLSMTKTSDGGYALAGFTRSYGAGGTDFWLVKVDADGTCQWNKTYGGTGDDSAHSIVQTSDGGYALAGFTSSFGAGSNDVWLVKVDSAGNMQWNKTFGGAGTDDAVSLIKTSDGGYALAGSTTSFGAGNSDVWVVKTDAYGNLLWSQTFGGSGADYGYSIIQTSDGGYAVAGNTASFGASGTDCYFIKLAAETPDSSPSPTPTSATPTNTPTQNGNSNQTATPSATPAAPELTLLTVALILMVSSATVASLRAKFSSQKKKTTDAEPTVPKEP